MNRAPHGEYALDVIHCGLMNIWRDFTDDHEPITPQTNIIARLKKLRIFEELDFVDLMYVIDNYFLGDGPHWRQPPEAVREWDELLGAGVPSSEWEARIAPTLTFGRVAEFIQRRLSGPQLVPARVLGTPCLTAGAFHVIQDVVRRIEPVAGRFRPTAAVQQVIRGTELRVAWGRLRWISANRLPPLRETWLDVHDRVRALLFVASIPVLFLGICAGMGIFAALAVFILVSACALQGLRSLMARWETPLPTGVRDFRDVARAMIGSARPHPRTEPRPEESGA